MSSGSTDARVSENVRFLGVGTGVDVDLVSLLVRISACVYVVAHDASTMNIEHDCVIHCRKRRHRHGLAVWCIR